MSKPALPTLEDVAKAADVSTATVSRCLNSPERVAIQTREKINAAVELLGYSPNFGAKALATKRTNTIGAIIPTMANAIFARGLEAFQAALTPHGATLLVASSYYDPDIEEQQIRSMIARGADGLLLIGQSRSDRIYEFIKRQNIPIVIAWSYEKNSRFNMVGFDNTAASRTLTELALEFGHKRFAFLSAETQHNDRARDRVTGTKQALSTAGIDPDSMPMIETPYSIDGAGEAFESLIKHPSKPTVVMCGNDVQAVGALKKARELGLRVPEEISITGFDDLEITTIVEPGITTVHVPHRQMGQAAAELLFNDNSGTQRILLPTYTVKRGSLAAPRES